MANSATARHFSVPDQGGPVALKKALLEVLDWFPVKGRWRIQRKSHQKWREVFVSEPQEGLHYRKDTRAVRPEITVDYWWTPDHVDRVYMRTLTLETWLDLASRGKVKRIR